MRTLIRAVTTRYGIAGLLVLGVLVVVTIARLVGGEAERSGSAAPGADPYASVSIGPDDGVVDPDDPSTVDGSSGPSDEPSLPRGVPDPRPVATSFATSWAAHENVTGDQWRNRLARHATASLMERLAETDPAAVPTDRVKGDATLTSVTGRARAELSVEMKGGVLLLALLRVDNVWLVDSIDWRRE